MKTCRKILALLIALSTVMSYVTGVHAEGTQPKTWNFINDWLAADRPLGFGHKDTYGNEGVWSVRAYEGDYKQSSELMPSSVIRENNKLRAWYWGAYQDNIELLGTNGMVRLNDSGTELYARVYNGYNHAYTWTAPESLVTDITVNAKRLHNNGATYFDLYQNDIKVQGLFTVSSPNENKTKTIRVAVKKGDRITVAVKGSPLGTEKVIRSEYQFLKFEIKEVNAARTELQSWEYRKDAFASKAICNSGVFGDTYGNHNTWGIYFGKTVDGTYKKEPGSFVSNDTTYVVEDKDDPTNHSSLSGGTRIYFKSTEQIDLNNTSYAEVKKGTDLYFVFRAPKDMYARLDVKVQNRWGREGQNVTVYNANDDVIKTGAIGKSAGNVLNFSEYAFLKTGETVEIKIDNSNTNTTAVNPYITVTEIEKTYNSVTDYKASGYPKQNTWNTFDKSSNWTLDYTLANGTTAVPTTTDGKTFILNETDGEHKDALMPGETYDVDGADKSSWYYLKIQSKGAKSNLKWTAPKDGMIEITYKGRTRWDNGVTDESGWHTMYVDFGIEKNGTKIAGFASHGQVSANVMSSVTRKIAVKKNDVINFTAESRLLENGMRGANEAVAYNNIKYIGEASGKLTFNKPTIVQNTSEDGTVATATFTGSNQTGEKATAAVILAEYDTDGSLINVVTDKIDDYEADFSKSISLPVSGNELFKTFIWDSLSGMEPIETVKANLN